MHVSVERSLDRASSPSARNAVATTDVMTNLLAVHYLAYHGDEISPAGE